MFHSRAGYDQPLYCAHRAELPDGGDVVLEQCGLLYNLINPGQQRLYDAMPIHAVVCLDGNFLLWHGGSRYDQSLYCAYCAAMPDGGDLGICQCGFL